MAEMWMLHMADSAKRWFLDKREDKLSSQVMRREGALVYPCASLWYKSAVISISEADSAIFMLSLSTKNNLSVSWSTLSRKLSPSDLSIDAYFDILASAFFKYTSVYFPQPPHVSNSILYLSHECR